MRTYSVVCLHWNSFKARLAIHLILQHFLKVSKGMIECGKLQQMTWSFACMADREQVEKFLLMEPPAMIPTLSPVQDLKIGFLQPTFHNCLYLYWIESEPSWSAPKLWPISWASVFTMVSESSSTWWCTYMNELWYYEVHQPSTSQRCHSFCTSLQYWPDRWRTQSPWFKTFLNLLLCY